MFPRVPIVFEACAKSKSTISYYTIDINLFLSWKVPALLAVPPLIVWKCCRLNPSQLPIKLEKLVNRKRLIAVLMTKVLKTTMSTSRELSKNLLPDGKSQVAFRRKAAIHSVALAVLAAPVPLAAAAADKFEHVRTTLVNQWLVMTKAWIQ